MKKMQVEASLEEIHRYGLKHKAVAVILYNRNKEILITLRGRKKAGGGFWEMPATHLEHDGYFSTGEECVKRELGITGDLKFGYLGSFEYKIDLDGYRENEVVEVLVAGYDGDIKLNADEVEGMKWVTLDYLLFEVINHPETCTFWLMKGAMALEKKLREYFDKVGEVR
jgi:isopentenyldiphosphate isomerase